MTLARTSDQASTNVRVGTEIRNISLTIRSYQYDKELPGLTETVERDDEDGFETVKNEFIDSIRQYVENGVMQCKIILEANPGTKSR